MLGLKLFSITIMILITQLLLIECQCPLNSKRENKLYQKLCYEPIGMASEQFTMEMFTRNAPTEGWFVFMGDNILRNHFAPLLKGKRFDNNYEDMCYSIERADAVSGNTKSGAFNGFGIKRAATWNCTASLDISGVYRCLIRSSYRSRYHQTLHFYFTNTEIKNLYVSVVCFSDGEVGWLSLSNTRSFSQEDHFAVENQVRALGFPTTDIVNMFNNNCDMALKIDIEDSFDEL